MGVIVYGDVLVLMVRDENVQTDTAGFEVSIRR